MNAHLFVAGVFIASDQKPCSGRVGVRREMDQCRGEQGKKKRLKKLQ